MITIFSIPKAFKGHVGTTQLNAIKSWMKLGEDCQVVVCGDDEGVVDAAREIGAECIPDIARNEFGTPLLSSAFREIQKVARHRILCFVNADIILLNDFLSAIKHVTLRDFLIVGQRWDMDVTQKLDFGNESWDTHLRRAVANQGKLHGPLGSDYFVFPNDSRLLDIPPFAVGRPGWDCWFIYRARKLRIPVVDASGTVFIVHQNHDYTHVKKGSGHTADGKRWYGPETDLHLKFMGNGDYYFTPLDATHLLTDDGLKRALDYFHLTRRWHRLPILYPKSQPVLNILDKVVIQNMKSLVRKVWA
jgi:hypothetical protein